MCSRRFIPIFLRSTPSCAMLCLITLMQSGCSSTELKKTAYGTLQNYHCMKNQSYPPECDHRDYEHYQREVEEIDRTKRHEAH
jgi:hypothetical protein